MSYFLSASDEHFQTRKNRDGKWIQSIKRKFWDTDNLSKKAGLDESGISSKPISRPYSENESRFIMAVDQVEEIARSNLDLFNKAE